MKYCAKAVLFVFFLTILSGCAGQVSMADPKVIYSTSGCIGAEKAVALHLFHNKAAWEQFFKTKMTAVALPAESVPEIAFDSDAVLVIDGGSRPSAGYGLQFMNAYIENGVLVVHVKVLRPSTDRMQAQVVTHPCMAIRVPAAGYNRIELYDSNQTLLSSMRIGMH